METLRKLSVLLFAFIALGVAGCDEKKNESNDAVSMIAGDDNKTWRIRKEVNEVGLREKTTDVERSEEITFNRDNGFVIDNDSETRAGRWTYDGVNLTLQFNDDGEMRVYGIEKLESDKLRLRAQDGSEVVFVTR